MNEIQKPKRKFVHALIRRCVNLMLILVAVAATLVLVQAFASRKMPDLQTWHRPPENEFEAADLTPEYGLAQYLKLEETLFDELSNQMLDPQKLEGHSPLSRFVRGGPQDPARQPVDWNRTTEFVPDTPRGGVLLLHGLSDSPYSMRSEAELFHEQGFHVLVMRMPGHGTVPGGLLEVTWEDWAAAVRVGVRHVKSKLGDSMPFFIGGYSNGGALAVHYTASAITNGDPVPDQLFLFSAAIGITPFARVARWDAMYGFIPYFEKSRWLDIEIEYDPYKYNSFTKNAGTQSWRLSRAIQDALDKVEGQGRLGEVPPILAFQSVVDDTVDAKVLITGLFERLEPNGSEVVFFDVNRSAKLQGFISLDFSQRLEELMKQDDLGYTVTRLTNLHATTTQIAARSRTPGSKTIAEEPLDLTWPPNVISLAHVSIPFPADDPLYGETPPDPPVFGLTLGGGPPQGERHVMSIPASQLIRLRNNPFHPYVEERILGAIEVDHADGSPPE